MQQRTDQCLTHDDLLKAMVDINRLPGEHQAHLDQCPQCQCTLERLEQHFVKIGQLAKKMAPEPSRTFRLPQQHASNAWFRFKPSWAMGLTAALVLMLSVLWPHNFTDRSTSTKMADQTEIDDQRLMAEIDMLVENALPDAYKVLAEVSEIKLDEDMLDWVAPLPQEDESLT